MKTFKFKTNIKDKTDLKALESFLKNIEGINGCNCELESPGKILTVKVQDISIDFISREIFKAGFRNEPLKSAWVKTVGKLFHKDCCK